MSRREMRAAAEWALSAIGHEDEQARALAAVSALTERERAVLALVAEGLSDRAIAERLRMSVRTVGVHLRHIYAVCLGDLYEPEQTDRRYNCRTYATAVWHRFQAAVKQPAEVAP